VCTQILNQSLKSAAHLALKKLASKKDCSLKNKTNLNQTNPSSPTTEFDETENSSSSSRLGSKAFSTIPLQQQDGMFQHMHSSIKLSLIVEFFRNI
jgi:hypothetical protein